MEFISNIEDVKKTIIENTQFIKSLENCSDDSFRAEIKNLIDEKAKERLELGEKLIRLKTKQKRIDAILQQAATEANTVEEFESMCEELFKKDDKKRINIKQTAEYKEFKHEFDAVFGNLYATSLEDDVTEVTSDRIISMYDPWSKALMLNPVRNTKCGHHYDQDSVNAIIKDNIGIRCPVVGCASKSYIQPNCLEPDLVLRDKIVAFKKSQEMSDSSSEDDM